MKSLVRFTGAVSNQFIDESKQTEEHKTNIYAQRNSFQIHGSKQIASSENNSEVTYGSVCFIE